MFLSNLIYPFQPSAPVIQKVLSPPAPPADSYDAPPTEEELAALDPPKVREIKDQSEWDRGRDSL